MIIPDRKWMTFKEPVTANIKAGRKVVWQL